jgi:hypothetical protein
MLGCTSFSYNEHMIDFKKENRRGWKVLTIFTTKRGANPFPRTIKILPLDMIWEEPKRGEKILGGAMEKNKELYKFEKMLEESR